MQGRNVHLYSADLHKICMNPLPKTNPVPLTVTEIAVLRAFRYYLMEPSRMLCFSAAEQSRFESAFRQLVKKELIFPERFRGGYSLTQTGYAAMRMLIASNRRENQQILWPLEC
jgi:hypothetical protein